VTGVIVALAHCVSAQYSGDTVYGLFLLLDVVVDNNS